MTRARVSWLCLCGTLGSGCVVSHLSADLDSSGGSAGVGGASSSNNSSTSSSTIAKSTGTGGGTNVGGGKSNAGGATAGGNTSTGGVATNGGTTTLTFGGSMTLSGGTSSVMSVSNAGGNAQSGGVSSNAAGGVITGGANNAGGAITTIITAGTGGIIIAAGGTSAIDALGGAPTNGGTVSTGGNAELGGMPATGGEMGTGGSQAGGATNTGGAATGGVANTGGSPATGGKATGGAATGGAADTGGSPTTGGKATGGAATGGAATGGVANTGGTSTIGTTGTSTSPDPDCNAEMPTSDYHTYTSGNSGSGNLAWWVWLGGGIGSLTVYSVPAFKATWASDAIYLGRVGFEWGTSGGNHESHGTIRAQFVANKSGDAGGKWSFIGLYGWTKNPCVEWYIIEDSFGNMPVNPGSCNPMSNSPKTIDGGDYTMCVRTMNGTGGDRCGGVPEWKQYYSIRNNNRTCGTISASEHFRAWEAAGNSMQGALLEAKLFVEVGGGSGNVEFPIANVQATQ